MENLSVILTVLSLEMNSSNLAQMYQIIKGIFRISGKVTGLNISRYTDAGGSYRSIQRFMKQSFNWHTLRFKLFTDFLFSTEDTYLLAADECVEGKAGKKTWGLGRFFSSLSGKPIRSIALLHLSILSVKKHDSYSFSVEQILTENKNKSSKKSKSKKKKGKEKGKSGRPKGSKNKNKENVELSSLLLQLQKMLELFKLSCTSSGLPVFTRHFVGDGAYGNNSCAVMCHRQGFELISKIRHDAQIYLPYEGPYGGKGRPKVYGKRLNMDTISSDFLIEIKQYASYSDYIYNTKVLHKKFAMPLNAVIIVRKHKKGKTSNIILFSTEMDLTATQIIDFYSLRFQIEFNFRDAKQYFGLSDFKNTGEIQVTNAINFSLFMTLIARIMLIKLRVQYDNDHLSIQDIKALFRSHMYVERTLKCMGEKQQDILNMNLDLEEIFKIGAINYNAA